MGLSCLAIHATATKDAFGILHRNPPVRLGKNDYGHNGD